MSSCTRAHGLLSLTVLVAIGLCQPSSTLAVEAIRSGDKVVTVKQARIVQGQKVLAVVEAGTELTASGFMEGWVGVEMKDGGKSISGWINPSDIKTQAADHGNLKAAGAKYPHELSMLSLPTYRIEPPDVLQIEVLDLVPLPPYRIAIHDVLQIRILGTLADQPISDFYIVEDEGAVNLGATYGTVRVVGMTIDEAAKAITSKLQDILTQPNASVQLARNANTQPVTGEYLVGPDGTINLRRYGAVHVTGKTLVETRLAVEKQLSQFFDSPTVSLDVASFNSKVYYVIREEAGAGEYVCRVPVTGNETVLDAISAVGGLSEVSSKDIWIARPMPSDSGKETILRVDWDAITRRGATATNYQIMPGDRVFIGRKTTPSP